jgi:hypothetical protein
MPGELSAWDRRILGEQTVRHIDDDTVVDANNIRVEGKQR